MTYNAKPNISDGKVCKNLFPRADFVVILLLIYRGMQAACRLLIQVRYAFMWASMLGRWFPPAFYFDPFSVLRLLPSSLTHHCQLYAQDCTYCRVTIKTYGLFIFYRPATVTLIYNCPCSTAEWVCCRLMPWHWYCSRQKANTYLLYHYILVVDKHKDPFP